MSKSRDAFCQGPDGSVLRPVPPDSLREAGTANVSRSRQRFLEFASELGKARRKSHIFIDGIALFVRRDHF